MNREALLHQNWRLCFVDDNWAYFTDAEITDVWGDDWNDAPHDCNAGSPYTHRGTYEIRKFAYDGDLEIVGTGERGDGIGRWGYLSVEDINAGKAPWLVQILYGRPRPDGAPMPLGVQIPAGASLVQFSQLVKLAGGCVYEALT